VATPVPRHPTQGAHCVMDEFEEIGHTGVDLTAALARRVATEDG
jgi:hypothetical protein